MNTSNLQRLCGISRENCNLKNIIEQQSSTIGVLLQEKRDLQEQYVNLLMSINLTSNLEVVDVVDDSSNIIRNIVENSTNSSNVV